MKVYLIKHKDKTWWGNFMHSHEIETTYKFYAQLCFYRRKDALEFLKKNYKDYSEYYEVVGAEISKSNQDNRKSN